MLSLTAPLEPILVAVDRLEQILLYRAKFQFELFRDYLLIVDSNRHFLISSSARLEALWDSIRKNQELTGFTLDLTREFYVRCHDLVPAGEGFTKYLAHALYKTVDDLAQEKSVIDQDTLEQIHHKDLLEMYLQNNWYLVILLTSMSQIKEKVLAVTPFETKPQDEKK